MGTTWRIGIDRDEKALLDHIWKHDGSKAPTTLRQMERNARSLNKKGKSFCNVCCKYDDIGYPKNIWFCRKCSRKLIDKAGFTSKNIRDVKVTPNTEECEWCWERDYKYMKMSFRTCPKCAKRFGKRDKYRESAIRAR